LLVLLGILGPMTELECALEENKILRILDAEKTARISHLELLLEKLTFQFAALKRMQFGQKSEASNALQAEMFGAQLIEVEAPADAVVKPVLTKSSTQPKATPRITIPKDLPVEETIVDIAESAKVAADGEPLKFIGYDVSDKLAIDPARTLFALANE
jgi:Transposase C of IS166 homeodomain